MVTEPLSIWFVNTRSTVFNPDQSSSMFLFLRFLAGTLVVVFPYGSFLPQNTGI